MAVSMALSSTLLWLSSVIKSANFSAGTALRDVPALVVSFSTLVTVWTSYLKLIAVWESRLELSPIMSFFIIATMTLNGWLKQRL